MSGGQTDFERLVVSLEARIAGYEREMRKANALTRTTMRSIERDTSASVGRIEGRMSAFAGSVSGVVGRVTASFRGIGAGLAGVAGVLGGNVLVRQVREALNWADALQDTSDRLHVNVETLQAWQNAAEVSGSSAGALESALDKLTVKIGDAVEGDKEALAAFGQLGISLIDAQGNVRTTEDVFRQLNVQLSKMPDVARRFSAETDLMGRSAMELDPLLSGGADGFAELEREAVAAGAVMSGEVVQAGADAADAMSTLSRAIDADLNASLISIGPILVWATGLLRDFLAAANEGIAAIANLEQPRGAQAAAILGMDQGRFNSAQRAAIEAELEENRRSQEAVNQQLRAATAAAAAVDSSGMMAVDLIRERQAAVDGLVGSLETLTEREAELQSLLRTLPSPQPDTTGLAEATRPQPAPPAVGPTVPPPGRPPEAPIGDSGAASRRGGARAVRDLVSALDEYLEGLRQEAELERLSDQERREREAMIRAEDAARKDAAEGLRQSALLTAEETAAVIDNMRARREALDAIQAQADAAALIEDTRTAEERLAAEMQRILALKPQLIEQLGSEAAANEVLERAVAAAEEQYGRGTDAALAMAEALGGAFEGAISGADDLNDALDGILLKLLEIAAQGAFGQGPAGGLFNDLFGVASGGLLGLFGGGGGGAIKPAGIKPAGIKLRARGGPVEAGDIAIVGEEGPEIVRFGRRGMVMPAAATRAALDARAVAGRMVVPGEAMPRHSGGGGVTRSEITITAVGTGNAELDRLLRASEERAVRIAVMAAPDAVVMRGRRGP